MKNIEAVTRYPYKGKEYKSLKDIKEELHNTIGLEVLDKVARVCPLQKHKDYEKLLELLCSKEVREVLTECFNVTIEKEIYCDVGFQETKTVNILDI